MNYCIYMPYAVCMCSYACAACFASSTNPITVCINGYATLCTMHNDTNVVLDVTLWQYKHIYVHRLFITFTLNSHFLCASLQSQCLLARNGPRRQKGCHGSSTYSRMSFHLFCRVGFCCKHIGSQPAKLSSPSLLLALKFSACFCATHSRELERIFVRTACFLHSARRENFGWSLE